MSTLHIFCPWHEEALASGLSHFTPTQAARRMADSLCTLPAWWAESGDTVWVPDAALPFDSENTPGIIFTSHPDFAHITQIDAWGWNLALRQGLLRMGCPDKLLPSEAYLQQLREHSSRRSTSTMLSTLQNEGLGCDFRSWWCEDEAMVHEIAARHGGDFIAKAPWSGSGRGVFRFNEENPAARQRIRNILQRQGGIEVEPFYKRLSDFAMEFHLTDKGCDFVGLSLFSTNEAGAYTGNLVAEDERLVEELCATAEKHESGSANRMRLSLANIRTALTHALPLQFSSIRGYAGVDMMLVQLPCGSVALHPCVEINLRRTMGLVAILMRRHLPTGCSEGRYQVRPTPPCNTEEARGLRLTPEGMPFEACLLF